MEGALATACRVRLFACAICSTDVCAEMYPPDAPQDDSSPAINERIDAEIAEFVAAGRHKHDVARGPCLMQDAHQL